MEVIPSFMLKGKVKVFYGGMSLLRWPDLGVALDRTSTDPEYLLIWLSTKGGDAFMHQEVGGLVGTIQ